MRLIDADALIKWVQECGEKCPTLSVEKLSNTIKNAPTIDAVPVGAYEQTRWERDMAISQLDEIGKSLCEKMDNVATVVRCKDCKHRPIDTGGHNYAEELLFPDDEVCPCQCGDPWYSWMPKDDWFCANGERSEDA